MSRRSSTRPIVRSRPELNDLSDIAINLLLDQHHLRQQGSRAQRIERLTHTLFPGTDTENDGPPSTSAEATATAPTPVTQPDATDVASLIQSTVQASATAFADSLRPLLARAGPPHRRRSSSRSGTARTTHSRHRSTTSHSTTTSGSRSRSPRRRSRSRSSHRRSRSRSRHESRLRSRSRSAWSPVAHQSSSGPSAGWMLTRKTKKKILAGDHVDFDKILSEISSSTGGVHSSSRSSDSSAKRKHVRDIRSWLQAWSAYAATLLAADPSRGPELVGYQAIIAQANAKYQFTAWSRYDTAFRLWASKTPGARWDTINNHLWAQCFTGRASAQVICFTCGQPGHWSSTCPLETGSPIFVPPCPRPPRHPPPPGLPTTRRSAVSSTLADAATSQPPTSANTHTDASHATDAILSTPASADAPIDLHKPDTPLQPAQFARLLRKHPDHSFVTSLLASLVHGFDLGYTGPRSRRTNPNLKSAYQHPNVVTHGLQLECTQGHMAGPYPSPPLPNLQCSGLGVVPKKNGSWRLIMHLSAPYGSSINDGIDPDEFHLRYKRIDDAVAFIQQLGPNCSVAKMDLKHAFRLCPVRRADWDLLGVHWAGQYYIDKRLPFGLRSSPALFNKVADAFEWILLNECGLSRVLHYLDDFFFAEPDEAACAATMAGVRALAAKLGILLEPSKEVGPSTILTFLGVELDTVAMVARLPPDKLADLLRSIPR